MLLLLLPTAIREITFGDVTLLLLLFLSDDLNVILVIDSLFELLLLLFEPEIELILFMLLIMLTFLGLTCCFDMLFMLVLLLLSNPLLPTTLGLNVSAANDYLHSFSYF